MNFQLNALMIIWLLIALTENCKLDISTFSLLSEPQLNLSQFILKCNHCVSKYFLLLQTFVAVADMQKYASVAKVDMVWMDGRFNHAELNLVLFWFVSLVSNITESSSFFKINYSILENKSFFF